MSARRPWFVTVLGSLLLLQACGRASEGSATTTCDSTPRAAADQPRIPGAVDVAVQRLGVGCGRVLVSSAIPLAPGMMARAQLSQLRLFVGGQEQPLYVEALSGTHADGSLRAVLVQFNYDVPATPVRGQLVFGQARTTAALAKPTTDRGTPAAVVLPTDPDYLISTRLLGPTVTVATSSGWSPVFRKYETDFPTHANEHWNRGGASWEENYYDRALIYYAWWLRTGEVEYWKRATTMAVNYRQDYLELNHYNAAAHWYQIEGIEAHYLLTGDEASRTAVGKSAYFFGTSYYLDHLSDLTAEMDNRMQARTLMAFLTAWKINAPSDHGLVWSSLLSQALTSILASQQPNGAYGFTRANNQCGYNKPFMVGLLDDALIKYHTAYNADARILPAIQRSVDYMWAHDWDATSRAFVYLDGPCPGTDLNQVPAPDLNNLIVTGYSWLYQQTKDPVYHDRADQIFAGGVEKAYLDGSKQFNQQYTTSFHHLAYRGASTARTSASPSH
jgi:hypothetical protein